MAIVIAPIAMSLLSADTRAAFSDPSARSFELINGVIVDPGPGVIYLMNPEGGIDAIEVASGKLIWRSTTAAKPLLPFDDRLVAQAEAHAGDRVLPIVVMNTAAHGEPLLSATVPLPSPAFASIDDAMGSSFTADASLSSGELEIIWRFTPRPNLGRPGPAPSEIVGAARIDLKTGQVQVLPDRSATTQRRAGPNGGFPADIKVEPGFNLSISSADGKTFLANKPAGTDATGWTDYQWVVYSLHTREKLGEIRMPASAAPFFVSNSTLVYVSRPYGRRIDGKWIQEPLELRAVDLGSGREMWKAPIRDTAYRGPFPPRP